MLRWRSINVPSLSLIEVCNRNSRAIFCSSSLNAKTFQQLEDDVVTKAGYLGKIRDFIAGRADGSWLMLEFSSLGFISKLFRTADLPMITEFLLMFYREKPVDWLLDLIFTVRYCNPEKSLKQCRQVISSQSNDLLRFMYFLFSDSQ
jgi:hypothetical protein